MQFLKMLLLTLLVCISSYCYAQDTIQLNTNYICICSVQKFKLNHLTIKVDTNIVKIKYTDIKSIRLKNIAQFEKIILLTPTAQALIVYPTNYKRQDEKLTLTENKSFIPIDPSLNSVNAHQLSREYYLERAGNEFITSGICLLIGSALASSTLLIPNTKDNISLQALLFVSSCALYLTSANSIISGGINLRRAAKAKSSRLSYRLSPTSGALCLSF